MRGELTVNIKHIINKLQEYGFLRCMCRLFITIGYCIFAPVYIWWIKKFCIVDPRKVLFASKPSFSDNSKALYDYLQVQNTGRKMRFIWLIPSTDIVPEGLPTNTNVVIRETFYHKGLPLKALYEVLTCRYLFFTHGSPFQTVSKRDGQTVVNLWHGCGYKDIQKSQRTFIEENPFDVGIVPGNVFVGAKSKFWGCEKAKVLPIGYPRYDLLKLESPSAKTYVDQLRLSAKKLIVWMPTMRNTGMNIYPEEQICWSFDLPLLESMEQLQKLNLFCIEHNIAICIKRHPSQVSYSCEKENFSNIHFVSNVDLQNNGVDLYAMLRYTDALISDYSSVAIDYLLLDKPIAFALDDFEQYKEARGFVFEDPLKYMPGHHLYTFEDMLTFIDDVARGNDPYKADRAAIMPEVHNPCENYCERVWETVKELSNK